MLKKALIVFFDIRGNFNCVNSSTASFLFNVSAKTKSLSATARILTFIASILKLWLLRVIPTVKQFTSYKLRFADCTFKSDETGPDLPIDVLPLDGFLIIQILNETVQIEEPISHMLSNDLPMEINKDLCVGTHHPLVLFSGVELAAIDTPAQKCRTLILSITLIPLA